MPLKSATPSKSDRQLKRWYAQFNRRYFNDELPTDASVWWEPTSGAYADCNLVDGGFRIRINPALAGWVEMAKLTLLHECIHIKLWPSKIHGIRFDREVQRLMGFKEIRALV
jgi:predicted metal-dependent hydrolase